MKRRSSLSTGTLRSWDMNPEEDPEDDAAPLLPPPALVPLPPPGPPLPLDAARLPFPPLLLASPAPVVAVPPSPPGLAFSFAPQERAVTSKTPATSVAQVDFTMIRLRRDCLPHCRAAAAQ